MNLFVEFKKIQGRYQVKPQTRCWLGAAPPPVPFFIRPKNLENTEVIKPSEKRKALTESK